MAQYKTQQDATTQDGKALLLGAKAGLLIAVGAPLVAFAFVGGAVGIWASIGVHMATQSSLAFFGAFAATAAVAGGSLALGQNACKRGAAAFHSLRGYGVTKMVGAVLAPTALAIGLTSAAPYMIPESIKTTFNAIAQKRDDARTQKLQNAHEETSRPTTPIDQTNTDETDVSGPSDNLVYVLESKNCDSETAKDMERFMTAQKTVFVCLPKFVP